MDNQILPISADNLPTAFEDVAQFAILSGEKLKSVRAEISAIRRLGLAREVLEQKVAEAQQIAEMKTYAEMRIGELTAAMPKAQGKRNDITSFPRGDEVEKPTKQDALEKIGIHKKAASEFERMNEHPEIVERVLAEKRESGDIASRSDIMKAITEQQRADRETQRAEKRAENAEKVGSLNSPLEAQGLFQTIVIDPPWDWSDEGDVNQMGRAKPDYSTMPIEEIERLPIDKIADENCHLYIWVTNRSLPKAFRLAETWGFRYITCLTWVKPSIGMGNYFRGSTEQVLFCVKGHQQLKRKDVGTHFEAPRGECHSAKPDAFYDLVESCSYGPYIDVFGRKQRPGWAVWGENDG